MHTIHKLNLFTTHFFLDPAKLYWATSHFDSSVKCTLSYWLATLQHIPCINSTFDGNSTSSKHRPTSLKGFVHAVFLNPSCTTDWDSSNTLIFSPAGQNHIMLVPYIEVGWLCSSSHFMLLQIAYPQAGTHTHTYKQKHYAKWARLRSLHNCGLEL